MPGPGPTRSRFFAPSRRAFIAWSVAWIGGCRRYEARDPRPLVVASLVPLGYFVDRIARDSVKAQIMIPPGANPHTHEPGMLEIRQIAHASAFLKVGHPKFPFEQAWQERLVAMDPKLRVIDGFAGVPRTDEDPHVWVSPRAVRVLVENLSRALGELVPAERAAIARRKGEVLSDIDQVDRELRSELSGLTSRRFLVFHPDWGYFAREYGLEQIDIEQQARDPRSLSLVTDRARADGVRVIFVSPQMSRQSAERVARDIGARVEVIDPLAYDWVKNMRHVGAAFRRALGS
jgi:zinc transport system substrate-binding protein